MNPMSQVVEFSGLKQEGLIVQKHELWNRVYTFQTDSSNDQHPGPFFFDWPWRRITPEQPFATLQHLYSELLLPWYTKYSNKNFPDEKDFCMSSTSEAGSRRRYLAWEALDEPFYVKQVSDMYGTLPQQLRALLRIDIYGNVISLDAINHSLCYFNMDHIFPNSRGGYTVQHNLMALSTASNTGKGPHIHNAIIKVLRNKDSSAVVKDLIVNVKTNVKDSKDSLVLMPLMQGIRVHHVNKMWRIACKAAGVKSSDDALPEQHLRDVIQVFRLILCCPWEWSEKRKSGKVQTVQQKLLQKNGGPAKHPLSHHQGSVKILHKVLNGMCSAIPWLPELLEYIFPSSGHPYLDSPLRTAALEDDEENSLKEEVASEADVEDAMEEAKEKQDNPEEVAKVEEEEEEDIGSDVASSSKIGSDTPDLDEDVACWSINGDGQDRSDDILQLDPRNEIKNTGDPTETQTQQFKLQPAAHQTQKYVTYLQLPHGTSGGSSEGGADKVPDVSSSHKKTSNANLIVVTPTAAATSQAVPSSCFPAVRHSGMPSEVPAAMSEFLSLPAGYRQLKTWWQPLRSSRTPTTPTKQPPKQLPRQLPLWSNNVHSEGMMMPPPGIQGSNRVHPEGMMMPPPGIQGSNRVHPEGMMMTPPGIQGSNRVHPEGMMMTPPGIQGSNRVHPEGMMMTPPGIQGSYRVHPEGMMMTPPGIQGSYRVHPEGMMMTPPGIQGSYRVHPEGMMMLPRGGSQRSGGFYVGDVTEPVSSSVAWRQSETIPDCTLALRHVQAAGAAAEPSNHLALRHVQAAGAAAEPSNHLALRHVQAAGAAAAPSNHLALRHVQAAGAAAPLAPLGLAPRRGTANVEGSTWSFAPGTAMPAPFTRYPADLVGRQVLHTSVGSTANYAAAGSTANYAAVGSTANYAAAGSTANYAAGVGAAASRDAAFAQMHNHVMHLTTRPAVSTMVHNHSVRQYIAAAPSSSGTASSSLLPSSSAVLQAQDSATKPSSSTYINDGSNVIAYKPSLLGRIFQRLF
ncbi:hypothetical protein CEUSTIGMA_g9778.t1 [Chlamydomonas eustigma]|uniref:Uncharacterized protein n=1 Tax=Chlamydomonas eustigma TaxID=1157962 RepID=A0A250XHF5_9CHLO|nr:hypothetical protein CEUSTIGMA_g9778.t1 [Chlamydomonas eustigma]|eukprot:GAX82349.1 hypothetical protein CEUSTIGMA_g9778.t1 [Chlamydomonas eustigma]